MSSLQGEFTVMDSNFCFFKMPVIVKISSLDRKFEVASSWKPPLIQAKRVRISRTVLSKSLSRSSVSAIF